jgi:glutaredoxin
LTGHPAVAVAFAFWPGVYYLLLLWSREYRSGSIPPCEFGLGSRDVPKHETQGKGSSDMADKEVKIYSLSTCSHCKSTKKFLSECTVQYDFVDVDLLEGDERKAILEDVKKLNPKCSFPTIMIGEKVIVGYKEQEIKEALGL